MNELTETVGALQLLRNQESRWLKVSLNNQGKLNSEILKVHCYLLYIYLVADTRVFY